MPNPGDISHFEEIWKTVALLNDCVALIIYDLNDSVIEKH